MVTRTGVRFTVGLQQATIERYRRIYTWLIAFYLRCKAHPKAFNLQLLNIPPPVERAFRPLEQLLNDINIPLNTEPVDTELSSRIIHLYHDIFVTMFTQQESIIGEIDRLPPYLEQILSLRFIDKESFVDAPISLQLRSMAYRSISNTMILVACAGGLESTYTLPTKDELREVQQKLNVVTQSTTQHPIEYQPNTQGKDAVLDPEDGDDDTDHEDEDYEDPDFDEDDEDEEDALALLLDTPETELVLSLLQEGEESTEQAEHDTNDSKAMSENSTTHPAKFQK